jgi:four helix bundle protein
VRTYRELKVWEKSHRLVLEIYECTRDFPSAERFGLTAQLRRAAVSIASNLAEGARRPTQSDFARHVGIARGSASETDYLVVLATELGYVDAKVAESLQTKLDEILRMLTALRLGLTT